MLKEPTYNPLNGPALSEEVCRLALERIKALLGCTEDASEERELIDWRRSRTPTNTPSTATTTCPLRPLSRLPLNIPCRKLTWNTARERMGATKAAPRHERGQSLADR